MYPAEDTVVVYGELAPVTVWSVERTPVPRTLQAASAHRAACEVSAQVRAGRRCCVKRAVAGAAPDNEFLVGDGVAPRPQQTAFGVCEGYARRRVDAEAAAKVARRPENKPTT